MILFQEVYSKRREFIPKGDLELLNVDTPVNEFEY